MDPSIDRSLKRCPPGLTDPNDPLLLEVEQRAALLRDLLRQSGWKVTAEVADAALVQLGIPRSTLFRAVARFRRHVGLRAFSPSSAEREMGVRYLIRGSNALSKSK